jgi:6-phosphofructokinase 1
VVVVGEGAGQSLMESIDARDSSGNLKLGDIGTFLKDQIKTYSDNCGMEVTLKYIDPSYMIRSVPASPHDSALCLLMAHNAVHAGMTGRTSIVIGYWKREFTHLPISLAVSRRKTIDPESRLWASVLACTGQKRDMR